MKLVLASEVFSADALPDPRTLRSDIENKRLPGVIVGKRMYIDVDALAAAMAKEPEPKRRLKRASEFYRV